MIASAQYQGQISARLFVVTRLQQLDGQMTVCEAGIVDAGIPEALHDFRVAIRKIRAVLTHMDQIMPEPQLSRFRVGFAELAKRTCPLRDLQVSSLAPCFTTPAESAEAIDTLSLLQQQIQQQTHKARSKLLRYLASTGYRRFRSDWTAFLQKMKTTVSPGIRANEPVSVVAEKCLRHAYRISKRKAQKAGKRTSGGSLHSLRKYCRDLRYLLEIYRELFVGETVRDLGHELKRMQVKLGEMQDLQVLYKLLRTASKVVDENPEHRHRRYVKQLLKRIKMDNRELKKQAVRLALEYPERSAGYVTALLG